MVEHTPVEVEPANGRAPTDRLWLSVGLAVGLILFVAGPVIETDSPRGHAMVLESASWADTIMEEGRQSVLAEAREEAPLGFLSRWLTTAALLLNPTGDDVTWARALACIVWMLSWWGIVRFIADREIRVRDPMPWLVLGVLLMSGPVRSAATGDLAGAWMLAAGVLFAAACKRLARAPQSTWSVGFLWGLLILIHPALLALGIPIFIFAAQAYGAQERAPAGEPGHAPLPSVPVSLLLSPAVAGLVVLVLWSLGGGSIRELITSVDQLWRQAHPTTQTALFAASPGMSIWTGLMSFGWAPTALAAAGALIPGINRQEKIALFVLATVFIAGGLNGRIEHTDANLMLFLATPLLALSMRIPIALWTVERSNN